MELEVIRWFRLSRKGRVMELKEIIEKITDPYERAARLYPALLAILPLITLVAMLYESQV